MASTSSRRRPGRARSCRGRTGSDGDEGRLAPVRQATGPPPHPPRASERRPAGRGRGRTVGPGRRRRRRQRMSSQRRRRSPGRAGSCRPRPGRSASAAARPRAGGGRGRRPPPARARRGGERGGVGAAVAGGWSGDHDEPRRVGSASVRRPSWRRAGGVSTGGACPLCRSHLGLAPSDRVSRRPGVWCRHGQVDRAPVSAEAPPARTAPQRVDCDAFALVPITDPFAQGFAPDRPRGYVRVTCPANRAEASRQSGRVVTCVRSCIPSLPACQGRDRRSDGDRFRGCILPFDALVFATPPERRRIGESRRDTFQTAPRRKLSPAQEAAIRANGGNRSLRELRCYPESGRGGKLGG